MATYVALFRGINVGGKNILPMKDLRALLGTLGCEDVKTYIQSGNAVFRHRETDTASLARLIREAIASSHGFDPAVLLLTGDNLVEAAQSNPFPEGESDPSKLHLFFLGAAPENPDLGAIQALRTDDERFALVGEVAYLLAPAGIARSKVAARAERLLGVAATARNWRSVTKILELAQPDG